jgi:hypothetical protein
VPCNIVPLPHLSFYVEAFNLSVRQSRCRRICLLGRQMTQGRAFRLLKEGWIVGDAKADEGLTLGMVLREPCWALLDALNIARQLTTRNLSGVTDEVGDAHTVGSGLCVMSETGTTNGVAAGALTLSTS